MTTFTSIVNICGTYVDWVESTAATISDLITAPNEDQPGYPIGTSFQKDDDAEYPMIYNRWVCKQKFSQQRQQYYAIAKMYVLFPKTDEWNLNKVTNLILTTGMGVSEQAANQVLILPVKAIDRLTKQDFALGTLTPTVLGVNMEIRTEGGWITEDMEASLRSKVPNDKFLQSWREFYIYY